MWPDEVCRGERKERRLGDIALHGAAGERRNQAESGESGETFQECKWSDQQSKKQTGTVKQNTSHEKIVIGEI